MPLIKLAALAAISLPAYARINIVTQVSEDPGCGSYCDPEDKAKAKAKADAKAKPEDKADAKAAKPEATAKAETAHGATAEEVAVLVEATVKADQKEEFLKLFKETLIPQTRKEEGNRRFDLWSIGDRAYVWYEVYANKAALEAHGEADHTKQWRKFRDESKGLEGDQVKFIGKLPEAKYYDDRAAKSGAEANKMKALIVRLNVPKDKQEAFLKMAEGLVAESRKELKMYRFDMWKNSEKENDFVFYEAFNPADGLEEHNKSEAYKKWSAFKKEHGVKLTEQGTTVADDKITYTKVEGTGIVVS